MLLRSGTSWFGSRRRQHCALRVVAQMCWWNYSLLSCACIRLASAAEYVDEVLTESWVSNCAFENPRQKVLRHCGALSCLAERKKRPAAQEYQEQVCGIVNCSLWLVGVVLELPQIISALLQSINIKLHADSAFRLQNHAERAAGVRVVGICLDLMLLFSLAVLHFVKFTQQ